MNQKSKKHKRLLFYGLHAVNAALENPKRQKRTLFATSEAYDRLSPAREGVPFHQMIKRDLDSLVERHAIHQGVVLEVSPLPEPTIEDIFACDTKRPIMILDQVTDPQNLGAVLRSCAAFNATALITQDRNTPRESGALAKAASGALECLPWIRVVNIARALDRIAAAGYWRIGLSGDGSEKLESLIDGTPLCLVMGAEGVGLRSNVASHCDHLARIAISDRIESLNVSTAAAIALYLASTSLIHD